MASTEYGEVVRVTESRDFQVLKQDGYAFISEHKPLTFRQYCREMTMARGRILYEVWDRWSEHVIGYIVPDDILEEAKAYRPASSPWPEEPSHVRNRLQYAYDGVAAQFERIPHVAAKSVAEAVYRTLRQRPYTKRAIENLLVDHVRHQWTSYEFRVKNMQQREAEVLQIIKPRMRDVLQSWLPQCVRSESLVEFLGRHDLLDAPLLRSTTLSCHGGLETVANLVTVVSARI